MFSTQIVQQFLVNLQNHDFSQANMLWLTIVTHGDKNGCLKDGNKEE